MSYLHGVSTQGKRPYKPSELEHGVVGLRQELKDDLVVARRALVPSMHGLLLKKILGGMNTDQVPWYQLPPKQHLSRGLIIAQAAVDLVTAYKREQGELHPDTKGLLFRLNHGSLHRPGSSSRMIFNEGSLFLQFVREQVGGEKGIVTYAVDRTGAYETEPTGERIRTLGHQAAVCASMLVTIPADNLARLAQGTEIRANEVDLFLREELVLGAEQGPDNVVDIASQRARDV